MQAQYDFASEAGSLQPLPMIWLCLGPAELGGFVVQERRVYLWALVKVVGHRTSCIDQQPWPSFLTVETFVSIWLRSLAWVLSAQRQI
jgi:hypothetical protein